MMMKAETWEHWIPFEPLKALSDYGEDFFRINWALNVDNVWAIIICIYFHHVSMFQFDDLLLYLYLLFFFHFSTSYHHPYIVYNHNNNNNKELKTSSKQLKSFYFEKHFNDDWATIIDEVSGWMKIFIWSVELTWVSLSLKWLILP